MEIVDLDAFAPAAARKIRINGVDHDLVDIRDLSYRDYLDLIRIEERLRSVSKEPMSPPPVPRRFWPRMAYVVARVLRRKGYARASERELDLLRQQLQRLIPTLSTADVQRMTLRQIGTALAAMQIDAEAKASDLKKKRR